MTTKCGLLPFTLQRIAMNIKKQKMKHKACEKTLEAYMWHSVFIHALLALWNWRCKRQLAFHLPTPVWPPIQQHLQRLTAPSVFFCAKDSRQITCTKNRLVHTSTKITTKYDSYKFINLNHCNVSDIPCKRSTPKKSGWRNAGNTVHHACLRHPRTESMQVACRKLWDTAMPEKISKSLMRVERISGVLD